MKNKAIEAKSKIMNAEDRIQLLNDQYKEMQRDRKPGALQGNCKPGGLQGNCKPGGL